MILFVSHTPYQDLWITGMSLSEVNIEIIPRPTLSKIKTWSNSSGQTVCHFDAEKPLKDCSHHFPPRLHGKRGKKATVKENRREH